MAGASAKHGSSRRNRLTSTSVGRARCPHHSADTRRGHLTSGSREVTRVSFSMGVMLRYPSMSRRAASGRISTENSDPIGLYRTIPVQLPTPRGLPSPILLAGTRAAPHQRPSRTPPDVAADRARPPALPPTLRKRRPRASAGSPPQSRDRWHRGNAGSASPRTTHPSSCGVSRPGSARGRTDAHRAATVGCARRLHAPSRATPEGSPRLPPLREPRRPRSTNRGSPLDAQDPTGAVFALWQSLKSMGPSLRVPTIVVSASGPCTPSVPICTSPYPYAARRVLMRGSDCVRRLEPGLNEIFELLGHEGFVKDRASRPR